MSMKCVGLEPMIPCSSSAWHITSSTVVTAVHTQPSVVNNTARNHEVSGLRDVAQGRAWTETKQIRLTFVLTGCVSAGAAINYRAIAMDIATSDATDGLLACGGSCKLRHHHNRCM